MTDTGALSAEQEALVAKLGAASDRIDQTEIDMESARAELGELARQARAVGVPVGRIERETGYSHGHVYALLGPYRRPRTAARRDQRRRVREGL